MHDGLQALVALACDKLSVDIPIVMQDDVLLAHTIDETIGNYDLTKPINDVQLFWYCESRPLKIACLSFIGLRLNI
jgi:hypothetical protein